MFSLEGKVAFVTGAATGIGFATTKELLKNNIKGVALVDIDVSKGQMAIDEIEKTFGEKRAIFIKADVSNRNEMKEAFETTVRTFNQLDIVINNAGIIHELQWEKCVQVNLIGVINGSMLAMEHYIPKYKNADEGVIVNIASLAGTSPLPECPVYCATKAAVINFTRSIGTEIRYEQCKVKALAVCPGYTKTDMIALTEEQGDEQYRTMFLERYNSAPDQTADAVAASVVNVIKEGSNGSVWAARHGNCSKIKLSQ